MADAFNDLIDKINTGVCEFNDALQIFMSRLKSNEFDAKNGNSLLDLKNKLLVQYLHNLSFFVLLKINGQKIDGQSCVQRLAELRCVFEKLRPIEAKLKYQIDKYIKLADNQVQDTNDPLNFKPTTEDFESDNDEKDEDKNDEEGVEKDEANEDGIYRPPKLAPVYCDVDENAKYKLETKIERMKRHALSSSLMKDLQKQYSDAPEEQFNNFANTIDTQNKEDKHRQDYEEENFTRKPLTKQEIARMKRLQNGSNLSRITSFDDARILLDENINMEDVVNDKKSKKTGKVTKKNGKKKNGKKKKIRYT